MYTPLAVSNHARGRAPATSHAYLAQQRRASYLVLSLHSSPALRNSRCSSRDLVVCKPDRVQGEPQLARRTREPHATYEHFSPCIQLPRMKYEHCFAGLDCAARKPMSLSLKILCHHPSTYTYLCAQLCQLFVMDVVAATSPSTPSLEKVTTQFCRLCTRPSRCIRDDAQPPIVHHSGPIGSTCADGWIAGRCRTAFIRSSRVLRGNRWIGYSRYSGTSSIVVAGRVAGIGNQATQPSSINVGYHRLRVHSRTCNSRTMLFSPWFLRRPIRQRALCASLPSATRQIAEPARHVQAHPQTFGRVG